MNMNVTTQGEDSRLIMDQFYNKISMESIKGGAIFHKVPLTKNILSVDSDEARTNTQITVSIRVYEDEIDKLESFLNDFEKQPEISPLIEQEKIYFNIIHHYTLITFEFPYIPKFNIDTESDSDQYINISLKEQEKHIDESQLIYKCEVSNDEENPALAEVFDQIKSQFYGRRWTSSIVTEDTFGHIIIQSKTPPIIGFAQSHEISAGDPRMVRCTCTISCPSPEDAANVGETIYHQLVGRYEYINNQIILNIDEDKVYVIISADCNVYPIVLYNNVFK